MNLYDEIKSKITIICGPCVIENEEMVMEVAAQVAEWQSRYKDFRFIFKSSFDKANRTSVKSFRGPGLSKGLSILEKVKSEFDLPITTDIHESEQAEQAAEVVDIIQIPAFLCRQTDLLLAAGASSKIINIKKAQFLKGEEMRFPVEKVKSSGNEQIMVTERGSMYGYQNLVVDYRNIVEMQELGVPVAFDATHSVQQPGGNNGKTGGKREYVLPLTRAAAALGVQSFFFEIHPKPDNALSDGPNMLTPEQLEEVFGHIQNLLEA